MSEVKMVIMSTDNLDESITFYTETLGMSLKFRDGAAKAVEDSGGGIVFYRHLAR